MGKPQSIKYNFVMNTILTVSTVLLPLITFPYVARVLLVEANGKISFATSVINYFLMFSSLGVPVYGIRACARVRDDKTELSRTTHELFFINMVTTALSLIAFFVLLFTVPAFQSEKPLFLICGISLLFNTFGMNWLYSALEKYDYITIRSLIFKMISIVCIFTMLHSPDDYLIYAAITVLSTTGSFVFNFIHARKCIYFRFLGQYNIRRHLKPIFMFFATTVAINVYTNLDILMLGFISGNMEVGYYSAAVRIRSALATLVVSLGTVLLPRLSYYVQKQQLEKFFQLLSKSYQFLFFAAMPITIYFLLSARECVVLLSGTAYEGAVLPLQFLLPTILLTGLSNITGTQTLVTTGREPKHLVSIIWGAIVDFLLNLVLIPAYGSSGAALSTLIAELVVLGVQCCYIVPILRQTLPVKTILQTICASIAAAGITLVLFPHLPQGAFLIVFTSALLYFAVYGLLLLLCKESLLMELLTDIQHKLFKRGRNKG